MLNERLSRFRNLIRVNHFSNPRSSASPIFFLLAPAERVAFVLFKLRAVVAVDENVLVGFELAVAQHIRPQHFLRHA